MAAPTKLFDNDMLFFSGTLAINNHCRERYENIYRNNTQGINSLNGTMKKNRIEIKARFTP